MALSLAELTTGGAGSTSANTQRNTASFTPTANALIVVALSVQRSGSGFNDMVGSLTLTNSAGLTQTTRVSTNSADDDWDVGLLFLTAPAGASPSSMTFGFESTQACNSFDWSVYEVTGQHASPIGATASGTSGAASLSITLSGAPASSSEVFAWGYNEDATIPTPSGFTSLETPAAGFMLNRLAHRTGSTSTSVNFGSFTNTYGAAAVALEIVAATGVTGTGAATIAAVTASGTGERTVTGAGAATVPAATAAGTGARVVTGAGAAETPAATASGVGARIVIGTGAATTPAATAEGLGGVPGMVTGTGAATIAPVTASGVGTVTSAAQAATVDAPLPGSPSVAGFWVRDPETGTPVLKGYLKPQQTRGRRRSPEVPVDPQIAAQAAEFEQAMRAYAPEADTPPVDLRKTATPEPKPPRPMMRPDLAKAAAAHAERTIQANRRARQLQAMRYLL